jgi:predicted nucleic acid-binding Zn finger protein|tara:strand:+ start:192 stop:512 length:321 start_codon:yes stop_codon:yes gene_type:complete
MIKVLQELTVWEGGNIHNGIYHVNEAGHLVQYNDKKFTQPMKRFSQSGRKFKTIDQYHDNSEATLSNPKVIIVKGSKGNEYKIIDGQCSCPGFVYRNDCKHVKELV